VIDGNNLGLNTFQEFSQHKSIGTSMSVAYLPNTGRATIVYISTETLDSLSPTRNVGALCVSSDEQNLGFNVNVNYNMLTTGIIST
jgi:hypothetical protein